MKHGLKRTVSHVDLEGFQHRRRQRECDFYDGKRVDLCGTSRGTAQYLWRSKPGKGANFFDHQPGVGVNIEKSG